jgi:hypothetical protein
MYVSMQEGHRMVIGVFWWLCVLRDKNKLVELLDTASHTNINYILKKSV